MPVVLQIILSPFVFIYSFIVQMRNWFFDNKIFQVGKVEAKVISVGNLTLGGSGKTPTVMLVAEMLKAHAKKVGVLSRGYGRSSQGYLLVSDGSKIKTSVEESGDEMYFMSQELEVPTAVAEKRVEGALRFIQDTGVDTIILDDAFQHRWIHRDIDILIIDQRFLNKVDTNEQSLIPLGVMRESFESIQRADIVIINRKFSEKNEILEKLRKYFAEKPVFTAYYSAQGIFDVKTHHYFNLSEFQGQKSLVVCGIARPHSFLNVLENNHIDITNKMIFTDHKKYSCKEVHDIRKKFYETNSYSVLTTQKDAVKLTNYSKELDDIDIYYLKIELKIDEQEKFESLILNSLK